MSSSSVLVHGLRGNSVSSSMLSSSSSECIPRS
eukprot:CAMPEP_0113687632 /NCGR_PEP_ID=MMETSP0038_2-20120614/16053_1 /TAXON_ID=2898 /ORGANISM="Cryptomonas paramecium" /LENGTH=32 /DNA_ID=CAMNT_0000608287 /DNA_START=93 /DNA_END=187 /DNA_ORIENTATION=- /assembly_acc=CAM_ASM_000170